MAGRHRRAGDPLRRPLASAGHAAGGLLAGHAPCGVRQGRGAAGQGLAGRRPAVGARRRRAPRSARSSQAAREDIHAALALPVTAQGEVTGVMEFFSSRVREPDEELMALLTGIGSLVGQFIRHRDAERDVRASEARKSAIVNAAFECIIGLDAHGRVTEFNPAAELTFARLEGRGDGPLGHRSARGRPAGRAAPRRHRCAAGGAAAAAAGLPTEATGGAATGASSRWSWRSRRSTCPGRRRSPSTCAMSPPAARRRRRCATWPRSSRPPTTRSCPRRWAAPSSPGTEAPELLYGYAAEEAVGRAAGMLTTERPASTRSPTFCPAWGGASGSSSSRPCTSARTDPRWTCR